MKYGVFVHDMIFPKYGKIEIKINKAGNLSFYCTPSLTPGKMPAGLKPGFVPKGTKIFDYEKTVVFSLTFNDCLDLIDYAKAKNPIIDVTIFRNSDHFNKRIYFNFFPDETDPSIAKFATIFVQSFQDNNEIKFNIPISFDNLNEIAQVIKSYVNCMPMIKLYCGVEEQYTAPTYPKK